MGMGAPAQIPDGSAAFTLPCKFQYCFVVKPNAAGQIYFAITPNLVGNFAISRGRVQGFPFYSLVTNNWLTVDFDSDSTLDTQLNPTAATANSDIYVTATFPDMQAGNPFTTGQNSSFYRVQSWRCVDSCAKITPRGPPLYAAGTIQSVRQSIVVDRVGVANAQGYGITDNRAASDVLSGSTGVISTSLTGSGYVANPVAIANVNMTMANQTVLPSNAVGNLRVELSSGGISSMAQVCSLVGAESYPAATTLHLKCTMQDTDFQPYVESAVAVVQDSYGSGSGLSYANWGQLAMGATTRATTAIDAGSYFPGTLPGYGHMTTSFFCAEGLPINRDAPGTEMSYFVECEACFELTLGRNSSVGRLARPAPPRDPVALDVVSDIQKQLPTASTDGNWFTNALGWYGRTMKQAIGASWTVGAEVARLAGFSSVGDVASALAKMALSSKTKTPALQY